MKKIIKLLINSFSYYSEKYVNKMLRTVVARDGMIPPSQVVSYRRWPNNKKFTVALAYHLPYN